MEITLKNHITGTVITEEMIDRINPEVLEVLKDLKYKIGFCYQVAAVSIFLNTMLPFERDEVLNALRLQVK